MLVKELKCWIGTPQGIAPTVRLSQYDDMWRFIFTVYNGDEIWQIPEGAVVVFNGRKADGTVFTYSGEISGNNAVVDCGSQIAAAPGKVITELRFADGNGNILGTANLTLIIEAAPLDGYTLSSSNFSALNQLVNQALASAASAGTAAEAVNAIKAAVGSPLVANTAAAMTNEEKVYVYTGSETGYTNGYWYYFDGSEWQPGGLYNAAAVQTDTTLSVSGQAADAKALGSHLFSLSNLVDSEMRYQNYDKAAITNGNLIPVSGSSGNRVRVRFKLDFVDTAYIVLDSANYVIRTLYRFTKNQTSGGVSYVYPNLNTNIGNNKFVINKIDNMSDLWVVLAKAPGAASAVFTDAEMAEAVASLHCYGYYNTSIRDEALLASYKGETSVPQEITRGYLSVNGNTLDRSIRTSAVSASIQRGESAPSFLFVLDTPDFYMSKIFKYPSTSVENATIIKTRSDAIFDTKFLAVTDANNIYYRVEFCKRNVASDYELTDEDLETINSSFRIFKAVDTSFSVPGIAPDSKATGEALTDNATAIAEALDAIYNYDVQLGYLFYSGQINLVSGAITDDADEKHYCHYRSVFANRVVTFSRNDIQFRLVYYTGTPSRATYANYYTPFMDGNVKSYVNPARGDRAVVEVYSETELSAEDVELLVDDFSVRYYKAPDEPDTKAYEQVISTRPNQNVISQVLAVCNNWYDHRADDNLYYGYDGILNGKMNYKETYQIDCSTFVGLVLRGYNYTDTSYSTKAWTAATHWKGNPLYDWAINPYDYREYETVNGTEKKLVRNTGQMAQWFVKNGRRVLIDENLANIEVGDILFFSRLNPDTGKPQSPNYFMKINHCAIVVSKERMTSSSDWDASTYPFRHMIMDVGHENGEYYGTNRKILRRYPLDLRPLEAPQHLTNTELTEDEMNSIYTNNINTLVLVCRPDFGALSAN